jgi:uncharacterized protein YggE
MTNLMLLLAFAGRAADAQVGGNVGYGEAGGRSRAQQTEVAKRQLARDEMPPTDSTMFIDASVLLNVKADEFVATFGIAEEAETVEACQAKMDATVTAFVDEVKRMGIAPDAIFVDLTAQTRVYGYKVEGNLAKEQLAGFELKKTVAIRFRDKSLIDRMLLTASRQKIYDLIKVDYIVTNLSAVTKQLAEAAADVIKAKAARYESLLGLKLRAVPQVIAERTSSHFPTDMYDSYAAGETEALSGSPDRSQITVQSLRKTRTFYYNPLTGNGFDRVIEPIILEPVVQFTHYLKLKYEIETRR